jgi:hypothetical protein
MFEHYFAVLVSLGQTRGLPHPALPDGPVQPEREGRKTDPNRRSKELFPQLDQQLDAWEAEHGWLYR